MYFVKNFDLSKLTEEDWNKILKYKRKFYIDNYDIPLRLKLKFPGFFTSHDKFKFFKQYVKKIYYQYYDKVFTPPRGNLENTLHIIIIGIAPGYSELSRGESNWLLGRSSKLLIETLESLSIFPYFTNVFKNPFKYNQIKYSKDELNEYLEKLINEIRFLKDYWDIQKIICLGSYKEYDIIFEKFDNVYRVWHPSYLLRIGKNVKYYQMKFKEVLNE